MTLKNTGEWQLDSGIWLAENIASGLRLMRTTRGHAVPSALTAADVAVLLQMPENADHSALFPPEFQYNPADGAKLISLHSPQEIVTWIPPFGSRPVDDAQPTEVNGLRKSTVPLALLNKAGREEHGQEDATLPLPPPGDYHFFSSTFGTRAAALVALDADKGILFGWLPASAKWHALHSADGPLISASQLPRDAWRAEVATAFHSRLYLPTSGGLACVTPDLLALKYQVTYVGKGAAVGAPLAFNHQVWAPLRQADGSIALVSVNADGTPGATLAVPGQIKLDNVSLPVAYGRMAVWPSQYGQLYLQVQDDGSVATQFLPWPPGIEPEFRFGSPYQAPNGTLWQLCFDHADDHYVYVTLGAVASEKVTADTARFCSGSLNYRFNAKLKTAPWQTPDSGDDSSANQVVIPLLEVGAAGVIGIKLANNGSLTALLEQPERMRLQLVWDDDNSETTFHTNVAARPWQLRLFHHEGHIWAYHPDIARNIYGWKLA